MFYNKDEIVGKMRDLEILKDKQKVLKHEGVKIFISYGKIEKIDP